jgi:septal ring factor EnvC (AmiA/AmiB activator)
MISAHTSIPSRLLVGLVAAVALSSCGDNPELVEKRERQNAELAQLRGELALVEEKLKNMPPDRSEELAEARAESANQEAELARLNAEIMELEARRKAIDAEFQEYRRKYAVR